MAGKWDFAALYLNGEPWPRSRLPESGYFVVAAYPGGDSNIWDTEASWFTFAEGDINPDWKNLNDVEVVSLRFWVNSRHHIQAITREDNVVHLRERTRYRFSDDYTEAGARYYLENVFEALDQPGEWYLDRPSGILHYMPLPGETPDNTLFEAPNAETLIQVEGDPGEQQFVSHISFQDLTFSHNNWTLPAGNAGDGQSAPEVEGAIVAALVVFWVTGKTFAPLPGADTSTLGALVLEFLFTFALVLVVLNTAVSDRTKGNSYYGLAIGFTVLAAAFSAGGLSGGAFNPAVGLGPHIVHAIGGESGLGNIWIYLVGPLAGGFVAALVFGIQEADA